MNRDQRRRPPRLSLALTLVLLLGTLAAATLPARPARADAFADWAIAQGIRAIGTTPYAPNTPGELALVEQYYERLRQNEAAALAYLANSLPAFNQELNYYQNVLASGGDPNVFFGQSSLPALGPNSLLDPLFSGPALLEPGQTPSLDSLLGLAGSPPAYSSAFLQGLNQLLLSPTQPAPELSFSQRTPPGSCSIGDAYQPTLITFTNRALSPIAIYLLDSLCQEVPYVYLLPGQFFISPTFVGQTWRFRDGITGQYTNNIYEYFVRDRTPQFFEFTTQFTGLAARAVDPADGAGGPKLTQVLSPDADSLLARYRAIGDRQLDLHYTDPALIELRAERRAYHLGRLYADPLALYLLHERDTRIERLRRSLPPYGEAERLAASVRGWTSPPASQDELRRRYAERLRLEQLESRLDEEFKLALQRSPAEAARIDGLDRDLQRRLDALHRAPEALIWEAAWEQRWQRALFTSNRGFAESQAALDLVDPAKNPGFAEYKRLDNEVAQIIPALAELPEVRAVVERRVALDESAELRQRVRGLADRYTRRVTDALSQAGAVAPLERFYEQANGLALADPAYRTLEAGYRPSQQQLDALRARVHAAVDACFARSGEGCDPASDRETRALLDSGAAAPLVAAVAGFAERLDSFWYGFYNGEGYVNLENQAKDALQSPLAAARPALDAARAEYDRAVDAIPQIAGLRADEEALYARICAGGPALSARPIGDPTAALCGRLTRMAELAEGFVSRPGLTRSSATIYLPLLQR